MVMVDHHALQNFGAFGMYLVEGKEHRFSNLMWCKLSHQMCTNHEPSVMNANENVLFLTWNPALR